MGKKKRKHRTVCKVYGTKWNCRMREKWERGDVKAFYSLLKQAFGVPPTHIHVYGVFMAKNLSIT